MNYLFVVLSFVVSVLLARIVIPRILLISVKKKLFDTIDERKIHTQAIPRLGGLSFFPTILFSIALILSFRYLFDYEIESNILVHLVPEYLLLICGLILLYGVGVADDLIGVKYRQKLVVQLLCASLIPIGGLYINNFYGLFGIYNIPSFVGIPLTILLTIFITNAINLIDGIDGLASGLSCVALVLFGFLFMQKEMYTYAILAFTTLGVLLPFFYYNVFGDAGRGRKIFMGDTGSLTLGYILSFLAIKYSMSNTSVTPFVEGAIVIAFSALIVPMFDVIRVVVYRFRIGKSVFQPDRNHIHHRFLAMGFSPHKSMIIILLISLVFCLSNVLLIPHLDNTLIFIVDILLWIVISVWFERASINIRVNKPQNLKVESDAA